MKKERVTAKNVFDDLDAYRAWCVDFGCRYDVADLYRAGTAWSLYQRQKNNKQKMEDNWTRDAARFGRVITATMV